MKIQQDRQCKHNVTLRRVWNHCFRGKAISITHLRAGARARGRVHVALLIHHATRMRHIVTSFVAPLALQYFWTLSHKRQDFQEKKNVSSTNCVF